MVKFTATLLRNSSLVLVSNNGIINNWVRFPVLLYNIPSELRAYCSIRQRQAQSHHLLSRQIRIKWKSYTYIHHWWVHCVCVRNGAVSCNYKSWYLNRSVPSQKAGLTPMFGVYFSLPLLLSDGLRCVRFLWHVISFQCSTFMQSLVWFVSRCWSVSYRKYTKGVSTHHRHLFSNIWYVF